MVMPGTGFDIPEGKRIRLSGFEAALGVKPRADLMRRMHARCRPVRNAVIIDEFNGISGLYADIGRFCFAFSKNYGYGLALNHRAGRGGRGWADV